MREHKGEVIGIALLLFGAILCITIVNAFLIRSLFNRVEKAKERIDTMEQKIQEVKEDQ